MQDDRFDGIDLEKLYELEAEQGAHLTTDQLLAIDLRQYDELAVYPDTGVDWALERKKTLFLQVAVQLGYPLGAVVHFTRQYFGQFLNPPPVGRPGLTPVEPFVPPPYDSRKTPEQWATEYDEASHRHRDSLLKQIREFHSAQIKSGLMKRFERGRQSAGIGGQKKAAIADEQDIVVWAVAYFFSSFTSKPFSWADLAAWDTSPHPVGNPVRARKDKRKRADQIRKRVVPFLQELGLPMRK